QQASKDGKDAKVDAGVHFGDHHAMHIINLPDASTQCLAATLHGNVNAAGRAVVLWPAAREGRDISRVEIGRDLLEPQLQILDVAGQVVSSAGLVSELAQRCLVDTVVVQLDRQVLEYLI